MMAMGINGQVRSCTDSAVVKASSGIDGLYLACRVPSKQARWLESGVWSIAHKAGNV